MLVNILEKVTNNGHCPQRYPDRGVRFINTKPSSDELQQWIDLPYNVIDMVDAPVHMTNMDQYQWCDTEELYLSYIRENWQYYVVYVIVAAGAHVVAPFGAASHALYTQEGMLKDMWKADYDNIRTHRVDMPKGDRSTQEHAFKIRSHDIFICPDLDGGGLQHFKMVRVLEANIKSNYFRDNPYPAAAVGDTRYFKDCRVKKDIIMGFTKNPGCKRMVQFATIWADEW